MRELYKVFLLALFLLLLLTGCQAEDVTTIKDAKSDKLQIVATLFPQYDFARQIAGDRAEVTLLLPPGVESHSYEPTPSDIIEINSSDLFIYTGNNMEVWSQKIVDGMTDADSQSLILDSSKGIVIDKIVEKVASSLSDSAIETQNEGHERFYDPHIWTDPMLAKAIVVNIEGALCQLDPINEDYYKRNADNYCNELDKLDARFKEIVDAGRRKEIIFGSRFALYYFTKRYGLEYEAAFDSCSSETEPSAKVVAELINRIKAKRLPVIYFAEIEDPKVARSISVETGAKMLLFHSCHNVSREELESGATYISLMEQNAQNLEEGLK